MSFSRWKFAVEAFHYLTGNQSGNPCEEGLTILPTVEDISFRNGASFDRITAVVMENAPDHLLVLLPAIPFIESVEDSIMMVAEQAELPSVMKIYKSSISYAVSPCREVRSAYLRLLLGTPGAIPTLKQCWYAKGVDGVEEKDIRISMEKEICWLETCPEALDEEGLISIKKRIPKGNTDGPPRKIH